ncbi:MAG: STAS domain-containing protein [Sciscionella sp.]
MRLVRHRSDLDVCLPVGEIDLCTAPLLRRALRDTAQRRVPRVIVDLSQVEFLGLEGIRVLVTAAEHARATHRHLGLVVATHSIWRALELTGMAGGLATYGCLSDALCELPAGGRDGAGR